MARFQALGLSVLVRAVLERAYTKDVGPSRCSKIADNFKIDNGTVILTEYFKDGDQVELPGLDTTCQAIGYPYTNATADICRVVVSVNTTETSSVIVEGWLPNEWNSRFLASGGGGILGCVDYTTMQRGVQLNFASFGMNGGHNGSQGINFLHKPEVLNDFGYRAMHYQAVVAKALIEHYYGSRPSYSYYSGCSTGGRQAISTALYYPDDFDGYIAGAPGINWIRIVAHRAIIAKRIGWPNINGPEYIPHHQWLAIREAQIKMYDSYDGVTDGVIDDPTKFHFNPEPLRCGSGKGLLNDSVCLTNWQIPGAKIAYDPVANTSGDIVYPGFEIGATTSAWSRNIVDGKAQLQEGILEVRYESIEHVFQSAYGFYSQEFMRGAVFNDTTWNAVNFTVADMDLATKIDPGRINTWDPDLSAFYQRGGKMLLWHGTADEVNDKSDWHSNERKHLLITTCPQSLPLRLSVDYYNWVQATLNLTTTEMQKFFRVFIIPGMGHCGGGQGAWYVGQTSFAKDPIKPIIPQLNTSNHDALLALVDWTEGVKEPTSLIGSKFKGTGTDIGGEIEAQRRKSNLSVVNDSLTHLV